MSKGCKYILVLVDAATRFCWLRAMSEITAAGVAQVDATRFLRIWVALSTGHRWRLEHVKSSSCEHTSPHRSRGKGDNTRGARTKFCCGKNNMGSSRRNVTSIPRNGNLFYQSSRWKSMRECPRERNRHHSH